MPHKGIDHVCVNFLQFPGSSSMLGTWKDHTGMVQDPPGGHDPGPPSTMCCTGGAAGEELSPRSWQCPWKVREYLHQGELWPSSAVCFLTGRSKTCLPRDNEEKSLSSHGKGVNEWGNSRFSFHICFLLALWSGQIPHPPGPVSHWWNGASAYKIQAPIQYWSLIFCSLLLDFSTADNVFVRWNRFQHYQSKGS